MGLEASRLLTSGTVRFPGEAFGWQGARREQPGGL
jgi:hypothetical protein